MRFISNSRIDGHPYFTLLEVEKEHLHFLTLESTSMIENDLQNQHNNDIGVTNLVKLHKDDPMVKLNILLNIDDLLNRIDEFEVIKDFKLDLISLNSLCDFYQKEYNEEKFRGLGFDIY